MGLLVPNGVEVFAVVEPKPPEPKPVLPVLVEPNKPLLVVFVAPKVGLLAPNPLVGVVVDPKPAFLSGPAAPSRVKLSSEPSAVVPEDPKPEVVCCWLLPNIPPLLVLLFCPKPPGLVPPKPSEMKVSMSFGSRSRRVRDIPELVLLGEPKPPKPVLVWLLLFGWPKPPKLPPPNDMMPVATRRELVGRVVEEC